MIVSIEAMVGLYLHLLSDNFGGITGVHYKVNNGRLILLHFAGTACIYFILHNIIALPQSVYVAIWHGFYFLKYYFNFSK